MGNDRRCDEKALTTRPGERKVIDAEIVSINGVPVARPEPESEQAPRMYRRRKRPPGRRTFCQEEAAVERSQPSSVTSTGGSASRQSAKLDGKEFRGLAARGPEVYEKGPLDDLVERKAVEAAQHLGDLVRSFLGKK